MAQDPKVTIESVIFKGGLNLVSPALELSPGALIDAANFEPYIEGGYRRMFGIERLDGRAAPSLQTYYNMACNLTRTVVAGNIIVGAISGATAVVLQVNGITELIICKITGNFVIESIKVGPTTVGTLSEVLQAAASTEVLHSFYQSLAANSYRSDIQAVPGNGPVRGAWYYNGSYYAFRDNGTEELMYQSTPLGWQKITFGTEILFNNAVGQINIGDIVTGVKSGATGVVQRALLRTGTWTVGGIGSLVFDKITGSFISGEALNVSGVTKATSTTASTPISLKSGGKFQFVNYNFGGASPTFYMYFCDGVNFLSEFDGTRLVPIRTGIGGDNPKFLAAWRLMLVAALDSSVEVSGIGLPYSWTALTGAAELALGAPCTGLKPQIGNQTAGTLTIFTPHLTYNLYGTSVADFNLVIQSPESGAIPYTVQNIGFAYYLDTKGVQQITTSQQFGGFIMATLTRMIQPIINAKQGLVTASCIVKGSNQYRLFFSDGTGIMLYMEAKDAESIGGTILLGDEVGGISYFDYSIMGSGWYLNTVNSVIDNSGNEQLIAAGSDGFVYSLDKGTSFDGNNILAHLMLPFNPSKSPRNNKHYKRGTFHFNIAGTANVIIGYTLNFGSPNVSEGFRMTQDLIGPGGIWDIMTWNDFTWDSQAVNEFVIDMPGDGANMGILIYGDTDQDLPYIAQDVVMQYIIRRQRR